MTNTETGSRQLNTTPAVLHEHGWRVESQHATSAGQVIYVRCGDCGIRRVDVLMPDHLVPVAISAELGPGGIGRVENDKLPPAELAGAKLCRRSQGSTV